MDGHLKIVVSAGELSGDQHLARLIEQLKQLSPDAVIRGMGGRHLRAQGVETIVDSEKSAGVMGFLEVLGRLPSILKARAKMRALLEDWKPDLLIVADYPDFNMRLIPHAKALGIKVVYFIPPKVWVWRSGRAKALGEHTDAIACIFPHEEAFLHARAVKHATFVGHPFCGDPRFERATHDKRTNVCRAIGLDPAKPVLLVMPGSRSFEINRHLPILREALNTAKERIPQLQCVVSKAPTISGHALRAIESEWIKVSDHDSVELMTVADAGLIKSGTSTLEAAFAGLPFACVYRATWIAEMIVRAVSSIRVISLPNLIRPGTVPELIQERFEPNTLAHEVVALLDKKGHEVRKEGLAQVVKALCDCDMVSAGRSAYGRAAELCLQVVVQR